MRAFRPAARKRQTSLMRRALTAAMRRRAIGHRSLELAPLLLERPLAAPGAIRLARCIARPPAIAEIAGLAVLRLAIAAMPIARFAVMVRPRNGTCGRRLRQRRQIAGKPHVEHGHALAGQPLDVAEISALLAIAERDGDAVGA